MDLKKHLGLSHNDFKKKMNRQLSQVALREQELNQQNILSIETPGLPRTSSQVTLMKSPQESIFPKPLPVTRRNLDGHKLQPLPAVTSTEKTEKQDTGPSQTLNRCESENLLSNPLNKTRAPKPQLFKKDGELLILGALFQNGYGSPAKPIASKDQGDIFQKKSFERLLSYFNAAAAKKSGHILSETGQIESVSTLPPVQPHSSVSGNRLTGKRQTFEGQRFHTEPDRELDSEEMQTDGIHIEKVMSELFTVTGTTYSWRSLDSDLAKAMNQKKEEYWEDVMNEHEPKSVEILVVDIVELMVKRRTEIDEMSAEVVAEKIEEHIKEDNNSENRAIHLLVFFHKENGEKVLVLTKYCFYFAKNAHFQEELKSEKDVVIYYFLMLGLCQLRMSLENEPLKRIKINTMKERAMSILKGAEAAPKTMVDWLQLRFNNHTVVQKIFFNLNNAGSILSTYIFNVRNFMRSRYPKLLVPISGENSGLKKGPSLFKRINNTQRSAGSYIQKIPPPLLSSSPAYPHSQSVMKQRLDTSNQVTSPNLSSQTPVLIRRSKLLDSTDEKIDITKLSTITPSPNLVSQKTDLVTHKLQPVRNRRHKTSNGLQKINTKFEAISQYPSKLSTRRNFLNINIPGLQDSTSSISPNTRQLIYEPPKQEPLSPWRDPPSPGLDMMSKNAKPSRLPLKNLAEEQALDNSDHSSSLRRYLEKDKK